MRAFSVLGAAALMSTLAACAPAPAADVASGIEVGGAIGSYTATKVGGIDDGVEAGKSLCYT